MELWCIRTARSSVRNCGAFKQQEVLYGVVVRLNSRESCMELWCVYTARSSVWNCGVFKQQEVLNGIVVQSHDSSHKPMLRYVLDQWPRRLVSITMLCVQPLTPAVQSLTELVRCSRAPLVTHSKYIQLCHCPYSFSSLPSLRSIATLQEVPRSGELRTQKLKSHLLRIHSLKVLPLKPGVGQNIAILATLTARDFFHAYFYPPGPFTCIFPKTSPNFSCVGCR